MIEKCMKKTGPSQPKTLKPMSQTEVNKAPRKETNKAQHSIFASGAKRMNVLKKLAEEAEKKSFWAVLRKE
ncbi:hypothetical protein SRHO_G00163930 [Serrasalmus rhombeus]